MVYEWKSGSRIKGNATEIGKEIETLGDSITASAVVDLARADESSLHECFEWDDSVAAEEYRLVQAREIMRFLVIQVEKADELEQVTTIRAYENVNLCNGDNEEKTMAYVPTKKALGIPELRKQIMGRLSDTIGEAERTAGKYEYISAGFGEVRGHLRRAKEALVACGEAV